MSKFNGSTVSPSKRRLRTSPRTSPSRLVAPFQAFLQKIPGKGIAPTSVHTADQVSSLEKECSRLVEAGLSYTKVGINFGHKAAQLVRDKLEDLDLELYSELDTNAKPTGLTTIVLEQDPVAAHGGPIFAMGGLIIQKFNLLIPDVVGGIHNRGEQRLEWRFGQEVWAEKTPDWALIPRPIKGPTPPTVVGENSFHHETLEELMIESLFNLELTDSPTSWALDTNASCQAEWSDPKLNLTILSKLDNDIIMHGPISFGAGSACKEAGLDAYQVKIACELLLKPDSYPQYADKYISLDLYHVRTVVKEHLIADKGLAARERADRGWSNRHANEWDSFARTFDIRRQAELSEEELGLAWVQMQTD